MAKKIKYYVVWVGQNPGIYDSWIKCQEQIKGFPNAKYKSFKTLEEAKLAFGESAVEHIGGAGNAGPKTKVKDFTAFRNEINFDSIAVDAACSGNPGIMEYRGVDTQSGEQLFISRKYHEGTNNVGEFLALVHGILYLQKLEKHDTIIYTDSRTALAWIRKKYAKTTLKKTKRNAILFEHLDKAVKWAKEHKFSNPLVKWETDRWGEIPADFGRK